MTEWKKYSNNRLICEHPAGFYIIKPEDMEVGQPLICPICSAFMNSFYDDESYQAFSCCDRCASAWARLNKNKWNEGWRPSAEEVRNKFKDVDI